MNKQDLRSLILKNRAKEKADSTCYLDKLKTLPTFIKSDNIASYCGKTDEINTDSINSYILSSKKNLFLPFSTLKNISFSKINFNTPLELNKKTGIFEPNKIDKDTQLDLLIIPSLACDKHGNRLGRGAGWYDRFLKEKRASMPNITTITLINESELFDNFDFAEEHDQKVDIIITNKDIYYPSK